MEENLGMRNKMENGEHGVVTRGVRKGMVGKGMMMVMGMMMEMMMVMGVVMGLVGCGDDGRGEENGGTGDGSRVALGVSGRMQTQGMGSGWRTGDAIGIYMVDAGSTAVVEEVRNRRYTTAGGDGVFSAEVADMIYFPEDGRQVDFVAYFPYTGTLTGGKVVLDVSDQADLAAIDLMTARATSTAEKPLDKQHAAVSFVFSHRLTMLELVMEAGNGLSTGDLAGLQVEITGQRVRGTCDPLTGTVEVEAGAVATVALKVSGDGLLAQAILLPTMDGEGVPSPEAGRELVFTLASGEVVRWTVPDDKDFLSGEKNLYTMVVNRTGIEVTSSITDWIPGWGEEGKAE